MIEPVYTSPAGVPAEQLYLRAPLLPLIEWEVVMKQMKLRRRHQRQWDDGVAPEELPAGDGLNSNAISADAARLLLRIIVLLDEERTEPSNP